MLGKDFGHLTHGRVVTSHASQGMTVDHVLIAMGEESNPAINREQFYVSVSRGRKQATVFTDVPAETLRSAIQRGDERMTATELMAGTPEATPAARGPRIHSSKAMRPSRNAMGGCAWYTKRLYRNRPVKGS